MLKKIVKLFFAKKIFQSPQKCRLLVLDNIFRPEFEKIINFKSYSFLDVRLNELNIFVLFKLFFSSNKKNFFNYSVEYIKKSKCKILLTFNDNLIWYYKLKEHLPYLKIISVQNSYRNKFFFKNFKDKQHLKADYIFTLNKSYSNLYKENIKTKTIEHGSFKNNFFKKKKIRHKNNSILFIASGYERDYETYKSKVFKPDTILVQNLYLYCEKNKINLEIAGRFNEKREHEFYKKILKDEKFKFHYNDNVRNLYNLSDKMMAVISSHSSFGIESLARGNRTAIFNNKTKLMKGHFDVFWFSKIRMRGIFWSNESNLKEVSRVLNFVIHSKEKIWRDKTKKIIEKVAFLDKGNVKFKKILNSLM